MVNQVTDQAWDKRSKLGHIEINGIRFILHRPKIGWDEKNFRPRLGYAIQAANDFNMSGRFTIAAHGLKALARKIEKHPHKLVKV